MGTFLVRSGVLTSVHAFAIDPRRGVFILAILVVLIGGALALFACGPAPLTQGGLFAPISREGALVLNNLLLTAVCATVFVGTLYPLALESLTGAKFRWVRPTSTTFGPSMLPLAGGCRSGPIWPGSAATCAARAVAAARWPSCRRSSSLAIFWRAPWLAFPSVHRARVYLVAGAVSEWATRAKRSRSARTRLGSRPAACRCSAFGARWPTPASASPCSASPPPAGAIETIVTMSPRASMTSALQLGIEASPRQGPNYPGACGDGGARTARRSRRIEPAKRFYRRARMSATEAGIVTLGLGQVYAALGDSLKDGTIDARLYFNPLMRLIWIGALVMALGGAPLARRPPSAHRRPRRARRAMPKPRSEPNVASVLACAAYPHPEPLPAGGEGYPIAVRRHRCGNFATSSPRPGSGDPVPSGGGAPTVCLWRSFSSSPLARPRRPARRNA